MNNFYSHLATAIISGFVVGFLCYIIGSVSGTIDAARHHATYEARYTILQGDTVKIDSVAVLHYK